MQKKVVVKQDKDSLVPVEVLAESIIAIHAAFKKMMAGKLNEKAIVLLIQGACVAYGKYPRVKPTLVQIKCVLDGLEALERTFIKKGV